MEKLIIFCAPSGTGKSTIISWLRENHPEFNLAFSISATSREPRGEEKDGVEYFFKTREEMLRLIEEGAFVEHEEVYNGTIYGTLKSQVEGLWAEGKNVIFDVDVNGGERIKNYYGDRALSLFILPPSIQELRRRLEGRKTDKPEKIAERIARAEYEIGEAHKFDINIVNDDLDKCEAEVYEAVKAFL